MIVLLLLRSWGCASAFVFALVTSSDESRIGSIPGIYRIQNQWTKEYLADMGTNPPHGEVQYGDYARSDTRAHWEIIDAGNDRHWIKNIATGNLMNIQQQSGNVSCYAINPDWGSPKWRLSLANNGSSYRITNAWKSDQVIHTQNQTGVAQHGSLSDGFTCSWWNLEMPVGASLPVVRYDENSDTLVSGPAYGHARLVYSSGYGTEGNYAAARAFEAEGQAHIGLGAIGWIATADADSLVIRFSLDDAPNGGGTTRTIVVSKPGFPQSQQIILDSKYAWLYGRMPLSTDPDLSIFDNPTNGAPRRAWDHIRVPLDFTINAGDIFRISLGGIPGGGVWIDFVETEMRPAPIPAPSGAIVVNPGGSISNAIQSASTGDTIYLAAGVHTLSQILYSGGKALTFQGAGMWHTTLHWNTATEAGCGIINQGPQRTIVVRDLHMKGELTYMPWINNHAIRGNLGTNSVIDSVWFQHFESAASYAYTENLQVRNCRVYDVFADGIFGWWYNSKTVYENNVVRHADADGLVLNTSSTEVLSDSWLCYHNTVEFQSRGAGIALHRHKQARVYGNLVKDCWDHGAFRATANFVGMAWDTETENRFCNNVLENNRAIAEIYLGAKYGALEGVRFDNNISKGSKAREGLVYVIDHRGGYSPAIKRVAVENNYFEQWNNTSNQYLLEFDVTANVTGEISVVNNDVTYTGAVAPGQYNTNPANIDLTFSGNIILPE